MHQLKSQIRVVHSYSIFFAIKTRERKSLRIPDWIFAYFGVNYPSSNCSFRVLLGRSKVLFVANWNIKNHIISSSVYVKSRAVDRSTIQFWNFLFSILELFVQRSQYISIKFSLLKIWKCDTNQDILLLATLQ